MNMTNAFALAALATLLAACNTMPDRNMALEQAHTHLRSAQADTQVGQMAAEELKRAAQAYSMAAAAHAQGEPAQDVTHLAYLADQRVTMAQETASARTAQADVARAGGERDKLRLAMRTREADAAQAQLSASKQINAQQGSDLAAARSNTQRGNERINDLEQELSKLGARKTDQGMVVTLGGVLFYTGQARLLPAARHDMSKLAEFFKRNPQRSARIEGNTDSVGGNEDNMDLSQRRATAVKDALTELGVSSERLSTAANGEDKPAATNDTSAGRQMNRRIEIIFSPMQDAVSTN